MPAPPELSEPAMVSAIGDPRAVSRSVICAALPSGSRSAAASGVKISSMRASTGTLSISHCPNQLSEPVSISMPVTTSSSAHHHLDAAQVAPEALQEADERTDRHRRQDERNAEPQRVDEQQAHAGAEARLVGGQRQHGRQHRADARRPAEGEGQPHDEGAGQARALACRRGSAPRDRAAARAAAQEVQAEADDDEPGDDRQLAPCASAPTGRARRRRRPAPRTPW